MGGSVFYNPDQPSAGQLANGAHVAIRLGTVISKTVEGEIVFSDINQKEVLGYISIIEIDDQKVMFNCKLYNKKAQEFQNLDFTLYIDESIDINNDNIPDLEYKKPLKSRPGLESAIYLNFLSSQKTFNTTMFAVLPGQYARGAYPSGIMGINPYGKFIVSKYEGVSSNRSLVRGLIKGDYVLDNKRGIYQTITAKLDSDSARALEDSELTDGNNLSATSFYFSIEEFNDSLKPTTLLGALPTSLTSLYQVPVDDEGALIILNEILKMNNMIKIISGERGEALTEEENSTVTDTTSLAQMELVSLNRIYLDKTFPEVCPQIDENTTNIADVLPLASCNIGESGVNSISETESRAASYTDYESQKNAIVEKFKDYASFTLYDKIKYNVTEAINTGNVILDDGSAAELTENGVEETVVEEQQANETVATLFLDKGVVCIKIGVKGSFSCSWGNIDSSMGIAIFLQAETVLPFGIEKTIYLLGEGGIVIPNVIYTFPVGPIPMTLSYPFNINLPIKIGGNINSSLNAFAGFTGLYGASCNLGADYGVRWERWFKVWRKWIKRPVPFFDAYANGELIGEKAYFAGLLDEAYDSNEIVPTNIFDFEGASAYVAFCPSFSMGPKLSIGSADNGPYTQFRGTVGFDFRYTISTGSDFTSVEHTTQNIPEYLDGIRTISFSFGMGCVAGFEIDIPIIGSKSFEKPFGTLVDSEDSIQILYEHQDF